MNRVVLECKGRLANQCLCWANARHVLKELGLTDRIIVINHPIPENCVHFPGSEVVLTDVEKLPKVNRYQLAGQSEDCLWLWQDVYANFPDGETLKAIIQEIELTDSFADQLSEVIQHDMFVGIHARFGDFVTVDPTNPPKTPPPFVRAPNEYFLHAMERCRQIAPGVRFFLASDGTREELDFITQSSDVTAGFPDFPLLDLFALSMCRLIIGSASTFSAVAAQYGDARCTVPSMTEEEVFNTIDAAFR